MSPPSRALSTGSRPRPDRTSADPEDGRRLIVSLTRAGQQMAEKAAPTAGDHQGNAGAARRQERETLVALLSKLRDWLCM